MSDLLAGVNIDPFVGINFWKPFLSGVFWGLGFCPIVFFSKDFREFLDEPYQKILAFFSKKPGKKNENRASDASIKGIEDDAQGVRGFGGAHRHDGDNNGLRAVKV